MIKVDEQFVWQKKVMGSLRICLMKPFSDLSKSNDISESKVAFIVTCHTLESCVFNIIYIYIFIASILLLVILSCYQL